MTLKLKLEDSESLYNEEFTDIKKLLKAAAEHIDKTEGACSLHVLQWDPKYCVWLAITEATTTLRHELDKMQADYIRLLKGVDNIGIKQDI